MTSKNLNWKNRKTVYKPRPFLLQPACKEALWGGQKLKEHFGKQADLDNIAESWVLYASGRTEYRNYR